MTRDDGPDLLDLQYHRVRAFRTLADQGFDVVRIWDFAQSLSAGNIPHISYGFLPMSLSGVEIHAVAATHYDCGLDLGVRETPDFVVGHRASVEQAIARGDFVPPDVRSEYGVSKRRPARPR